VISQNIAPVYPKEIAQFCQRVEETFQPVCVILHGSLARGTNTTKSDVDIIVISDDLPQNFLERLYQLNRLRPGAVPLEVLGYTLVEWEQMLEHLHLTALEALHWGVPLIGEARFAGWREKLETWQALGLQREATSWIVPPILRHKIA
jgi:predicted nucleotidyltransferase